MLGPEGWLTLKRWAPFIECFLQALFSMLCVFWVILMPTSGRNCQPLLQMRKLRQWISYLTPSVQVISARRATEALDHLCSGVRPSSGKEAAVRPAWRAHRGHDRRWALCQPLPSSWAGVGFHFLLQGIFPTQVWDPPLLHWEVGSLPLYHLGQHYYLT